jgi:hypothetical protein
MNIAIPLDQQVFQEHTSRPEFKLAKHERRWEILLIRWPNAFVRIYVEPRSGAPDFYDLRFECAGYPNVPPTALPWDSQNNQPLPFSRWPAGRYQIPSIFNPGWKGGVALYLPCDRQAIEGHGDWLARYPHWVWKPEIGIVRYIRIVHGILNSPDYTGIRGT